MRKKKLATSINLLNIWSPGADMTVAIHQYGHHSPQHFSRELTVCCFLGTETGNHKFSGNEKISAISRCEICSLFRAHQGSRREESRVVCSLPRANVHESSLFTCIIYCKTRNICIYQIIRNDDKIAGSSNGLTGILIKKKHSIMAYILLLLHCICSSLPDDGRVFSVILLGRT